jgi:hypothetical protein
MVTLIPPAVKPRNFSKDQSGCPPPKDKAFECSRVNDVMEPFDAKRIAFRMLI